MHNVCSTKAISIILYVYDREEVKEEEEQKEKLHSLNCKSIENGEYSMDAVFFLYVHVLLLLLIYSTQ